MYEAHFGLQEAPFALTPNTRYFVRAPGHMDALELLLVALREREGFIKITGEVGTGKTLLCRLLLKMLDLTGITTAYVPNPGLTPASLYQAVADELDVPVQQKNPHRLLSAISQRLIELAEAGQSVALVIDEAQAMPEQTIEALRLLTNLETETDRLLQVVLFGQPELDALLDRQSLRQLKQRITFQYSLAPLTPPAAAQYVRHRLTQAGYTGQELFSSGALRLLVRASGGIPRLLSILSHKALIAAWGEGHQRIERQHIRRAARDTESAQSLGLLGGWV